MRRSIVGLRACHVSTIIFTIVAPNCANLVAMCIPNMPPFLGSLIDRHLSTKRYFSNLVLHTLVWSIQSWGIIVLSSLTVFLLGNIFVGTVLCLTAYLDCLLRWFEWFPCGVNHCPKQMSVLTSLEHRILNDQNVTSS